MKNPLQLRAANLKNNTLCLEHFLAGGSCDKKNPLQLRTADLDRSYHISDDAYQKGLEVCYCLWGVPHPDPRPGPILGPSRSHPESEVVPSRFAMCFVLQCFGPIQVPRWGPSRPVLVPSCSRAFLTGSGLNGQKQTSWPLPSLKCLFQRLKTSFDAITSRDGCLMLKE